MKKLLAVFFAALALCAEISVDSTPFFIATYEQASATTGTISIQAPALLGKRLFPQRAYLYCANACTAVQKKDATLTSGSVLTAVPLGIPDTAIGVAYSGATVASGSSLPTLEAAAATMTPIDLKYLFMPKNGSAIRNYSLTPTQGSAGKLYLAVIWAEQ